MGLLSSNNPDVYNRSNGAAAASGANYGNMSPAYWAQQQKATADFYKSLGTTPQAMQAHMASLPPDQQKALGTQLMQAQNAYFNPDSSLTKAMGVIAPALAIGAATWGIGGTLAGPAAGAEGAGTVATGAPLYDTGGLLAQAGGATSGAALSDSAVAAGGAAAGGGGTGALMAGGDIAVTAPALAGGLSSGTAAGLASGGVAMGTALNGSVGNGIDLSNSYQPQNFSQSPVTSSGSWLDSLNWGDILKSGGSILSNMYTGQQNANAAQNYANAAAFKPTNVTGPGGNVTWNNGAPTTSLNPQGQGLMTGAGNLAGTGLNNLAQGNYNNAGGYLGLSDPLYQQGMNTQNVLNQQAPTMAPGQSDNYNALMNNTAMNAAGLMNGGGPNSFNQDWNTNYNNTLQNLRDTQQFGNTQAAQGNLNSLFGKGILNSSAGTSVMQGFANSLNQQDAMNQQSAMQNANQQSQLGVQNAQQNLGIGANYLNNYGNMQNQAYSQFNNAYGQAGQRSQQNLSNWLNMFQQGNQAQNQQYNQNTGLFTNGLNGYQAMDTSSLNWLNQSGVLGGRASAANSAAFLPGMQVAQQNNNNINGGVNSLMSNLNLNGLFGTGG